MCTRIRVVYFIGSNKRFGEFLEVLKQIEQDYPNLIQDKIRRYN